MKKETDFFERVFAVVNQVPEGKVTTYGAIAAYLGAKSASRMVGWAMNAAHSAPTNIPAHRVVNRKGLLTGKAHFQTPDLMQSLLENEGFVIKEDQILNFEENLWEPMKELKQPYDGQ